MKKHMPQEHLSAPGPHASKFRPASVQTYFSQRPEYFEVNRVLVGLKPTDLYARYIQDYGTKIESTILVPPPSSENEVPPLLRITSWHTHLGDYTTDRPTIRSLVELMVLPTSKKGISWLGSILSDTIFNYMDKIRKLAANSGLRVKCLLMECPRYPLILSVVSLLIDRHYR